MRNMHADPTVAYVLIAVNVLMYLGQRASRGGNAVYRDFVLCGPLVADGEWWRLLTAGFLHSGLFHLAAEHVRPVLPRAHAGAAARPRALRRDLLRRAAGGLVRRGAAGARRRSMVGASTAIFGLLGAAIVMARNRGIDIMASGLGPILI